MTMPCYKRLLSANRGEKCFLLKLRTQEVTSQIKLTAPAHIHTHTYMQVVHPAAVGLIPGVSSSAALSHPSTLSFTSRQHTPGVEGTRTASKDLFNVVEMIPVCQISGANHHQWSFELSITVIHFTAMKKYNMHTIQM